MNLIDFQCVWCGKTGRYMPEYPVEDIFGHLYYLARCPDCKTWSLQPRPSPELLSQAYDDTYYGESNKKFSFPLVENILDWFRNSRGRLMCRYLNEGDRMLDIGCGNGKFLASVLKRKNIEAWGIEPPGKSADRASLIPGIRLKKGYLEKDDFKTATIKVVTLIHVFEHLPNPVEILNIIDDILMPGGYLMISYPNIISWQSKFFKNHWLHLDPPRHLFFIEPNDLKNILQSRNYTILRENYFSAEQNPFGAVQSILNCFSSKRDILFESLKGNSKYCASYPKYKLLLHKIFFFMGFPVFFITNLLAAACKKGATVEFIFQKNKPS